MERTLHFCESKDGPSQGWRQAAGVRIPVHDARLSRILELSCETQLTWHWELFQVLVENPRQWQVSNHKTASYVMDG